MRLGMISGVAFKKEVEMNNSCAWGGGKRVGGGGIVD
jgi:hypothetical protein